MPSDIERDLQRWLVAGLLEPATADRIRQFEQSEAAASGTRLRWPVLVALGAGGLMLGAGVLLLVSAHWAGLAPGVQFALVLLLVAAFHAAGAATTGRFEALATTFHALGTAALGAGIFLAGQIFNLQGDWPSGILLWAVGAALGWWLRREWPQAAFVALLAPAWLVGQWLNATQHYSFDEAEAPVAGLLLLSLAYLWAEAHGDRTPTRRVLAAIGATAVLPLAVMVSFASSHGTYRAEDQTDLLVDIGGALIFVVVPLALGWILRRREAWPLVIGALWVRLGMALPQQHDVLPFIWGGVGAVGLTAAGVFDQSRLRVNIGVIGFGLTVAIFYLSSVMDRLGRSASLMVGGVLLLAGGWMLERLRRRLVVAAGTIPE